MATFNYTTTAREDAIIAKARGNLTAAQYVDQLVRSALEQVLVTVQEQSKRDAVDAFKAAVDAGQDLRVRFDANGFATIQQIVRS